MVSIKKIGGRDKQTTMTIFKKCGAHCHLQMLAEFSRLLEMDVEKRFHQGLS